MHAYERLGTGLDAGRDRGRTPRTSAPRPTTTAAHFAHLQSMAGNAAVAHAVQRDRHQHAPGCGHGEDQAVVQRDTVADAVHSSWRPLEPRIRERAENGLGMDLGDVRVHTDAVAQRSAVQYGARAYTSGKDIVVGPQGVDDETMFHELTHVRQQASGPVAGTDNGAGVKVSHPNDPFEQHAAESGRRLAQGVAPNLTMPGTGGPSTDGGAAPVQRYQVFEPGQEGYPTKHPDPDDQQFFVGQDKNEQGSWYDQTDPPLPHYVYEDSVRLAVSDDFKLAVQHGAGEPKTFFATEAKIKSANDKLPDLTKGRGVALEKTGRHLTFEGSGRKEVLYEVRPKGRPKANAAEEQHGLDVRVPQRCNAMAEFVTGQRSVDYKGDDVYWESLGKALDKLDPGNKYEKRIKASVKDPESGVFETLTLQMSGLFQKLLQQKPDEMERVLKRLELNEHAKLPKVGDAMMVKAEPDEEQLQSMRSGEITGVTPYHFGGVVAKAGNDYVTMENYARGEQPPRSTLDGGDPLWYFAMYSSSQPGRSWHECWATPSTNLVGAALTITLRG
ncbi:DUF4157 domain-containing protein [Streptomyces sp. NPDC050597]|nr:DUF4157 domain-containing protein [Streptomyces sp. NBC_00258]